MFALMYARRVISTDILDKQAALPQYFNEILGSNIRCNLTEIYL